LGLSEEIQPPSPTHSQHMPPTKHSSREQKRKLNLETMKYEALTSEQLCVTNTDECKSAEESCDSNLDTIV